MTAVIGGGANRPTNRRRLKRDARPLRDSPRKSKGYRMHVRKSKSYRRRLERGDITE